VAFLRSFGKYLPDRIVTNEEFAGRAGVTPQWIREVSGINERRFAAADQTVVDLAVLAGRDCLERANVTPSELGMVIVASGTADSRFPGPAAAAAQVLGAATIPALDVPMPSSGPLFAMYLASHLVADRRQILVIGAEKMSTVIQREPIDPSTAVLFGDGAGACLVSADTGFAEILASTIHSDGSFTNDLFLDRNGVLTMNGRSVILQASRKVPRAIIDLLAAHRKTPADVGAFLMHQANLNLIARVAQALNVPPDRFFTNVDRYGNTSSASMLIAAAEWRQSGVLQPATLLVFAAFGAGFSWGALLASTTATV
jgi:3-oxoacyl-[acyl-carrier-protein] synthase-3